MAGAFEIRGVMLDPARFMDRKREYSAILPHLKAWGYNLLHLHITDDQGCRLVFPRRPELASPGAFTPEEMRELVAEARGLGVEVMPEIESLGHSRFVTDNPRYAEVAEPVPASDFNALCPYHPETRAVLSDILADTAEIFDHPVIHVGLDEVRFGDCPRCLEALGGAAADASSEARFTEHVRWVHDAVRALGRRPAMWGDHALKSERIVEAIESDVLIYDWHYDPAFDPASIEYFVSRGFEVVEAPASVCWASRLGPTSYNIENLRRSTAESLRFRGRGLSGVMNTVWVPQRYLSGVADPAIAFAGHLMTSAEESRTFPAEFAESYYGVPDAKAAGEAVFSLYGALLTRSQFDGMLWEGRADGPGGREYRRIAAQCEEHVRGLMPVLEDARESATRNADRLEDVVLTAEIAVAAAAFARGERPAVSGALLGRVEKAWTRTRPDGTFRIGEPGRKPSDSLLDVLGRLSGA